MGQCKNISAESTILDDIWNIFWSLFQKHIWSLFQKHIWSLLQNISGHFSKTFLVTFPKTFLVTYPKNLVTLSTSMDDEFKTSGTDPLGWTNSLQSDAGAMSSWGRFDETISDVI
jgi:hypothetical protein